MVGWLVRNLRIWGPVKRWWALEPVSLATNWGEVRWVVMERHCAEVEWSCQFGEKGCVKAFGESWETRGVVGSRVERREGACSDQNL